MLTITKQATSGSFKSTMISLTIEMSKILQEPRKGYLTRQRSSNQGRLPGGGDNPSRLFKESYEISM